MRVAEVGHALACPAPAYCQFLYLPHRRHDIGIEGARARGDEHIGHLLNPGVVVRRLFVRDGTAGIKVNFYQNKACRVVLLLEKIEAGDAGLFGAGFRVDSSGFNEGCDALGLIVGVNDEDVHTPSII
jgi:hypothetical protein